MQLIFCVELSISPVLNDKLCRPLKWKLALKEMWFSQNITFPEGKQGHCRTSPDGWLRGKSMLCQVLWLLSADNIWTFQIDSFLQVPLGASRKPCHVFWEILFYSRLSKSLNCPIFYHWSKPAMLNLCSCPCNKRGGIMLRNDIGLQLQFRLD